METRWIFKQFQNYIDLVDRRGGGEQPGSGSRGMKVWPPAVCSSVCAPGRADEGRQRYSLQESQWVSRPVWEGRGGGDDLWRIIVAYDDFAY